MPIKDASIAGCGNLFIYWANLSLWVVGRGRISEFIRESLEVDGMEVDEKGFCGLPRFVEGEDEEGERVCIACVAF